MKKLLLFLLPLSLILSSCGADPVKYNDQLVDYIDEAGNRIVTLNEEINNLFENNEYNKLKDYTKATTDSLKGYIEGINKLDKPEGADEFHNSAIAYIQALIVNAETMGEQYSKITEEMTDEEFEELNKPVIESEDVYSKIFQEMTTLQRNFAKEKNFDLTNNK